MKYIYLIKSLENGYYKIGISKNPFDRIKNLQTGNPEELKLITSYKSDHYNNIETALHNYFSYCKKHNEWFDLGIEDELNFITLCEKYDQTFKFLKENQDF